MTEQNTTPAEAVERVAKALYMVQKHPEIHYQWEAFVRDTPFLSDTYRNQATAAIDAHTAWLWERAMQPDVVEAGAKVIAIEELSGSQLIAGLRNGVEITGKHRVQAERAVTAALTLLLGPQKEATDDQPAWGWGRMKRELMEWMNEYAELHGPAVDLRRPSHRANLAYFLACRITGEPLATEKEAPDGQEG